ncbi:F0F1 ATP synthase subunit B [Fulvivirga sedimenti]|uniref:ATP synthase subunit b n=1 Tax=Fulvivirga sedimenti TaxID=2879465 RepID=A0A9X1HU30_9BACT|nr:F0F1 ATP synthase subunit B [Fulvivirga sedimenti]MCA6078309.1 F0F1 ATP synthase subunit B [Fulvivirga sedimenti]
MELLTPGTGLIIWQTIIFLLLFFLLAKFAWKPILSSLKIREESIQSALDAAEKAKDEMAKLQADNKKMMDEARVERDAILKEARDVANNIKEEAKNDAAKQTEKMIADAKLAINTEKQAAMSDVKNQVAGLVLEVTENILRERLQDDKAQTALIEKYVKDANLN